MALKHLCSISAHRRRRSGCRRPAAPAAAPEEPEPLSVTRWTDKTELFAEYPPLVAGSTSRFAIHLTRLDTFKALTEGSVEVRLQGGAGQPEVFRVDSPSRPGIFGVDVKPAHAGKRELVIVLKSSGLGDEHRVGDVDVHATAEAARAAMQSRRRGRTGHQLPEGAAMEPGLRYGGRQRSGGSGVDSRSRQTRSRGQAAPRTSSRRLTGV